MAVGFSGDCLAIALMAITLVTAIFDSRMATRASLHAQWLHKLNSQLVHREGHDSLTDLPSRGLFIDRLEQAIAEVLRLTRFRRCCWQ